MTNQQDILDNIAKLRKGLSNPNIPESAKQKLLAKISEMEVQLAAAQKEVEKKEEKIEKQEEKAQEDLQATVDKLEKGLKNPNIPESAKAKLREKIDAAKKQIAENKQQAENDKQQAEKEKEQVKEAVKDLKEVAKDVKEKKTPKPINPKLKQKIQLKEKERKEKSEKRNEKIEKIMTELEVYISKNKKLTALYDKSKPGSSLERDAARPSKPAGYRFVGKHDYRDPKKVLSQKEFKKQLANGKIDYENRPNRADVKPKGSVKLAQGGALGSGKSHQDGMRTAKPSGLRYKDGAVGKRYKDGAGNWIKITAADVERKHPSMAFANKYPTLVYSEARPTKSDKKPSVRNMSYAEGGEMKAKGGKIGGGKSPQDKQRFAKPNGWRWKDSAVDDGIIKKAALAKPPSESMRKKHPEYVYMEARPTKSDRSPSRKYVSV